MSHEHRFATDRRNRVLEWGYCTTDNRGKICYGSRKDARRMIRKRPFLAGCNAYWHDPAEGGCGWWHIGHLPPDVVAGRADRAAVRATMARKARRLAARQERDEWLG